MAAVAEGAGSSDVKQNATHSTGASAAAVTAFTSPVLYAPQISIADMTLRARQLKALEDDLKAKETKLEELSTEIKGLAKQRLDAIDADKKEKAQALKEDIARVEKQIARVERDKEWVQKKIDAVEAEMRAARSPGGAAAAAGGGDGKGAAGTGAGAGTGARGGVSNEDVLMALQRSLEQLPDRLALAVAHSLPTAAHTMTPRESTEYYQQRLDAADAKPEPLSRIGFLQTVDEPCVRKIWDSVWAHATEHATALDMLRGEVESDEDYLQPLMSYVHAHCLQQLAEAKVVTADSALAVRDTSANHAPLNPWHKFDHCFVPAGSVAARENARVDWPYVVHVEQIKAAAEGKKWAAGRLQLTQDFARILRMQPGRTRCTGHLTTGVQIQLWWCADASDKLTASQRLDFLVPNAAGPTDGFRLYLRLLATKPAALGYRAASVVVPPELYDALKWPRAACTASVMRPGTRDKSTLFAVDCSAPPRRSGSNTSCVVKTYPRPESFDAESKALADCASDAAARPCTLTLLAAAPDAQALAVAPRCAMTLYEAAFSVPLFVAAVRSAVPLLSFFHATRRHVHGDVSPHNALIVGSGGGGGGGGDAKDPPVVLWNDFGGSVPIGEQPMCFTAAYASMSFAPDRDAVRLTAQDDWEALFFTLLHFSYADPTQRRRHLPWESLSDAPLWIRKTRCVSLPSHEAVKHVQSEVRGLMAEWHGVLFHGSSGVDTAAATVALLSKFVAQSASDAKRPAPPAPVAAAAAAAPAAGAGAGAGVAQSAAVMNGGKSSVVIGAAPSSVVWIAPIRSTVYHATKNAHKAPKKGIPLADALAQQLTPCKKGCYPD